MSQKNYEFAIQQNNVVSVCDYPKSDKSEEMTEGDTKDKVVKTLEGDILKRFTDRYPDLHSVEPTNHQFYWRFANVSGIAKVSGTEIRMNDLSVQDLTRKEDGVLYQLENTLDNFFLENIFEPALANDADHPTDMSSVRGWQSAQTPGLVCLREITRQDNESLSYSMACGQLLVDYGTVTNSDFE
ncbi:MAG: hypothetical protein H6782_01385 [Candidatus Nomurabacteria bacterium]|nr:MAG: hypothetical protein H6782_01385 [Candidatus Nomurabacteria bacterium]